MNKIPTALCVLGAAALLTGFATTSPTPVQTSLTPNVLEEAAGVTGTRECEGCTPGYWKNHLDEWADTGYQTTDIWDTVFGVHVFGNSFTLLDALNQGGGGVNALARHSTAALLNGAHPDVNYCFPSNTRLFSDVQKAIAIGMPQPLARRLDKLNNAGCPLN